MRGIYLLGGILWRFCGGYFSGSVDGEILDELGEKNDEKTTAVVPANSPPG
jgi:hypothetical protein